MRISALFLLLLQRTVCLIMNNALSRSALVFLLVAQALAVLPLLFTVPKWLPFLWVAMVYWRVQIFRGRWGFPSRIIKYALSLVCVAGLFLSYSNPFALEPAVAFLTVAFVLKLGELHERRDGIIIINIGFIAIAANFLFMQSALAALFALCVIAVHIASWSGFYRLRAVTWQNQMQHALGIVVYALPVMVLLFLLMPRLGTFWNVPLPEGTGKTGFGDTMSPGDLTNLIRSSEVSFRATFTNAKGDVIDDMPASQHLYWRGIVLDSFDGRQWRRAEERLHKNKHFYGHTTKSAALNMFEKPDDQRYYEVIVEPHNQPWLFSLAAPVFVESKANRVAITDNSLVLSNRNVVSRIQYSVNSLMYHSVLPAELSNRERSQYVQLPNEGNMLAREQANAWYGESKNDVDAYIKRVLDNYQATFVYTLQPPKLGENSVDDFLFQTQRGFCEYFASSFVFLMRAAGIPARVVLGYQGGKVNQDSNYLIVRQSDAHAWAEVWREGAGWQRVDPTAAVAPSRIEYGLDESLREEDRFIRDGLFGVNGQDVAWLNYLSLKMDSMNYNWHRWVLTYDEQGQKSLLKRLFGSSAPWVTAMVIIVGSVIVVLLYFVVTMISRRKIYNSETSKYYAKHLLTVEKIGFIKSPNETPMAFAQRVAKEKPKLGKDLYRIAVLYNNITYAGNNKYIGAFIKAVRNFPS